MVDFSLDNDYLIKCYGCLQHLSIDCFYKSACYFSKRAGKFTSGKCKKCVSIATKRRYEKNKEKISIRAKEYREKNKEHIAILKKQWVINNIDKVKANNKEWREANKNRLKARNKEYQIKNKERIRAYKAKWENERRNKDDLFKLRRRISNSVRGALKKLDSYKNGSTIDYLPYSIDELKYYIESKFEPWMDWSNWGIYSATTWDDDDISTWTWQIDHIIPQSKLPYDSMKHPNFIKCWGLNNLRPISAKFNILRGVK